MSREYKGRCRVHDKGYFFRAGRGWFTKVGGRFVPLTDKAAARIKDENAKQAAKDAYARHLVECGEQPQQTGDGKTVEEVVAYYLKHAERENRASTYKMRADTLFDFVYGLPSKWRTKSEAALPSSPKPTRFMLATCNACCRATAASFGGLA